MSTWPPHSQDPVTSLDRPHTISTAYEKGHQRPPLTVYTFQNPDGSTSTTNEHVPVQKSPANVPGGRPPLPIVSTFLDITINPLTFANVRFDENSIFNVNFHL